MSTTHEQKIAIGKEGVAYMRENARHLYKKALEMAEMDKLSSEVVVEMLLSAKEETAKADKLEKATLVLLSEERK